MLRTAHRAPKLVLWLCAIGCLSVSLSAAAPGKARAEVVVVVDTSLSIHKPGFDPERTSLLVTRLLSDIVPGKLAVIRVLDLERDKAVVPSKITSGKTKCPENPSAECNLVEEEGDWVGAVRNSMEKAGLLERPSRGDVAYKKQLEQHLTQNSNNSLFGLSFETGDAWFQSKNEKDIPRVLVWLSDGEPEDTSTMQTAIGKLRADGVKIDTIVFGKGRTDMARKLGLDPKVVHNPAELMKAFADTFREIVDAPYRLDGSVGSHATFEMKPLVSEAWVVVYGDENLGDVSIDAPDGPRKADYAADRFHEPREAASAGGYKVLYVENPPPGQWTVHAVGGGSGVAYAVIQRSDLYPVFQGPPSAFAGKQTEIVAGIARNKDGSADPGGALPANLVLTAEWQGRIVELRYDSSDGKFRGPAIFPHSGTVPVNIRLHGELMDRQATGQVQVGSSFRFKGGPITVKFGDINASNSSCRPVFIDAKQEGEVMLKIRGKKGLPRGHSWTLRSARGSYTPGKSAGLSFFTGDSTELCLGTGPDAYSSEATGQEWVEICAGDCEKAGSDSKRVVRAYWKVSGVSWLDRNLKYIFGAIGLLLLALWIYGFIWPIGFPGRLALQYAAELEELDEQQSQPLAGIRSARKRWYRHARAFFHNDYRVNGKPRGALVGFAATRAGITIQPESGNALFRLNSEGEWAPVDVAGRRAGVGDVYRANERGPFLRLEQKGGLRR